MSRVPCHFLSCTGAPWLSELLQLGGSAFLINLPHICSLDLHPNEKFCLHPLYCLTSTQTSICPALSTVFVGLYVRDSGADQTESNLEPQQYNDASSCSTGCQTAAFKYPDVWHHVEQNFDSLAKYSIVI